MDGYLSCLVAKGGALFGLKRFEEARRTLNRALMEPALTEVDEASKKLARSILSNLPPVRTETKTPAPNVGAAARRYGTGFFVSADGHIITNFHVIEGCYQIETRDGTKLQNIGSSPQLDLAVLRVDGGRKQVASFRNAQPAIGEPVIAFGLGMSRLFVEHLRSGRCRD
jgi:S1-C subfamily serine protease